MYSIILILAEIRGRKISAFFVFQRTEPRNSPSSPIHFLFFFHSLSQTFSLSLISLFFSFRPSRKDTAQEDSHSGDGSFFFLPDMGYGSK